MDAIVAVYSDWGIGAEGTQPIVIPEDRRHFAKLTRGAAVIVGRRTMEDFPGGKPLKDRENLVITRHADEIEGATIVRTAKDAVEATKTASASLSSAERRSIWPCSSTLTAFTSPR